MPQRSLEIVKAAVEAWNRGDWDAALKDAAPSFEFDFSRSMGPGRGIYTLDEMRRYFDEFAEAWESLHLEPEELIQAGDQVVMTNTLRGQGRDGLELQARSAWVWTIHSGRIERLCFYQQRVEALDAVGLAEQGAQADS